MMNTTINSILESFNSLELPEISETTASYGTIASTLLLGAAGIYAVYKRYNPSHTLKVNYATETSYNTFYNTLQIQVSGDKNTLPNSLKKQLLEKIQTWQGPNEYRFFPSHGIKVLPQGFDNQTQGANLVLASGGSHPFARMKDDFYLDRLNTSDIDGWIENHVNNATKTYSYKIFANDQSPPEILDGVLEDILNVFNIKG